MQKPTEKPLKEMSGSSLWEYNTLLAAYKVAAQLQFVGIQYPTAANIHSSLALVCGNTIPYWLLQFRSVFQSSNLIGCLGFIRVGLELI